MNAKILIHPHSLRPLGGAVDVTYPIPCRVSTVQIGDETFTRVEADNDAVLFDGELDCGKAACMYAQQAAA